MTDISPAQRAEALEGSEYEPGSIGWERVAYWYCRDCAESPAYGHRYLCLSCRIRRYAEESHVVEGRAPWAGVVERSAMTWAWDADGSPVEVRRDEGVGA